MKEVKMEAGRNGKTNLPITPTKLGLYGSIIQLLDAVGMGNLISDILLAISVD